jgi:hypothetical protein
MAMKLSYRTNWLTLFDPWLATAPRLSLNCRIPALVLAPPLPPVGNVSTKDSEGVPSVSSSNTTTALPLALFVLVSTNTLRPSPPATAHEVTRNIAASKPPARLRLIFKVLFSFPEILKIQGPLRLSPPGAWLNPSAMPPHWGNTIRVRFYSQEQKNLKL